MKIVQLNAENIKKLQAVEIRPNGEIVNIVGRNGQGKTSILDSIWWALTGTTHIQAQPIRKGETKARIRLDMGEIVVERRFTETNSTLTVENAEGARFPSPQKMLDALLGELSFDPLAFSRMDAKKQFEELRRVAKVEIDLTQLEGLNRSDFAKRTDVNRDAKAKRAQADGMTYPTDTPSTAVDEAALVTELDDAGKKNAELEQRKARRTAAVTTLEQKRRDVALLREQAAGMRAQADALDLEATRVDGDVTDLQKRLDEAEDLPTPIDTADVRARIAAARTTNENVQKRVRREQVIAEAVELERQAAEFTDRMAARDKEKLTALAAAKMPVDGLGFGDGIVTFNGIPLEQCSSAEQLRISLGIAMAANPKIKVIRIQDGSLLDEGSLASVAAMAKENDYQIWIERVSTDGKVGILIEDGMVKAEAEAPAVAAA